MISNILGLRGLSVGDVERSSIMSNIDRTFRFTLLVATFLSAIILLPNISYSQEAKAIEKATLDFAQKALEGYCKNVVNKKNFGRYGFKTLKGSQVARVGKPYRVMAIGLDNLLAYNSGAGAKSSFIDPNMLWFPVIVDGKVRTRVEIIQRKRKLIAGAFGGTISVQKVAGVANQLPKLIKSREVKKPYNIMLVKIPSMRATFLYIDSSEQEFLVPAMVQPQRFKLKNGQMYRADEVLSQLKEVAKKIDPKKVM